MIYEFFQKFVLAVAKICCYFSKSEKTRIFLEAKNEENFLKEVRKAHLYLKEEQQKSSTIYRVIWLHVASAGELEQAIPAISPLVAEANCKIFLTFFSPSTLPFVKRLPGLIGYACFPLDSKKTFKYTINCLNISDICFVRYDIWPQLIRAAEETKTKLYLLAANATTARFSSFAFYQQMNLYFKKRWLNKFYALFLINEKDKKLFAEIAPKARLYVTCDPKWNRAKEKALSFRKENNSNISQLSLLCTQFCSDRKRIIFGSPHKEEHEVAIELSTLKEKVFLIYVPHEVGDEHTQKVVSDFHKKGVKAYLYSEICQNNLPSSTVDCLIINKIGFLAESYPLANLAIIGGGFDTQIHNTLESAAHYVPTLFGDSVRKAREAKTLLEHNAALGFESPSKMLYFIKEWANENSGIAASQDSKHRLLEKVSDNAKAIFAQIPNTSEIIFDAFLNQ